ncbi:uroporphyrinogen-III synthase [Siculibacillus lacustris]|nr:uroporphyrinogen-III synthase [Siculibacillus lacustris]
MAARLVRLGNEAIVAPLMEVVATPPAHLPLDGVQALLSTSRHAVEALAGRREIHRLPLLVVGAGTAKAARAAGFSTVASAEGDRHTLVRLVCDRLDPADGALLWVAGRDRTRGFREDLAAHGFGVGVIEVYRAEAAQELPYEARRALEAGAIDAVAVHSPRSAAILLGLLADCGFPPASPAFRIHAISEATAAPFRKAGWTDVVVAASPDSAAMMATFGDYATA